VTLALVVIISLTQIALGLAATFGGSTRGILSALSTVVYAVFYFITVKAPFRKTLFTILMLSNIANFVVTAAKCLEGVIFGNIALEPYRWTFSLMMTIVEIVTLVPLFFYIKGTYSTVFELDSSNDTWRFLWLIPTTFYLVWYYYLYGSHASSLEIALAPNNTIMLLLINLGALLIYHTIVKHIRVTDSYTKLMEENYQLATQNHQYESLQERINEARHAKHDIRHHITIMDNLLMSKEYERLHEYLQSYKRTLPDDGSIILCNHYATNTILLFFAQQAKEKQIDFSTSVTLPKNIPIPDNVLSVILGNLLENALEACITDTSKEKQISVKGKFEPESGSLFFKVENTYSGEYIQNKKGLYLSTKHSGRGLGLASVRNIVANYDGIVEITPTKERFIVSVLLMTSVR
jgi:sensor histidine kinase YesM